MLKKKQSKNIKIYTNEKVLTKTWNCQTEIEGVLFGLK